jgi:LDH2 family malate/lactate/ureidoglycolate dehydrogenase
MAVNVSEFTDLEAFKKTTGDILRELRASKKAPGHDRIYTAGEKEYLAWLETRDRGVPIDAALQKNIADLVKELNLKGYDFPFLR